MIQIQIVLHVLKNKKSIYIISHVTYIYSGQWKIFSGNEMGILLGHWVWTCYKEKHPEADPSTIYPMGITHK